jgi:lipocalin
VGTRGEGVAKIRGSVIKDPRDWARTAYGPEAYQAALAKLSAEERVFVEGPILAGSWYPIAAWDRFLAAMRAEAKARTGQTEHEFNLRNMRESGPRIVRGAYKILLGLFSTVSVIEKGTIVFNRCYSEGRCEIVKNERGEAVIRYRDASPDFRTNLRNNFMTGLMWVLELNGARNVAGRISSDEIVEGKLVFEVTLTYSV